MTTKKFRFEGTVNTVSQTGAALTESREGINLEFHTHEGTETPHSVEVYSDDQTEYADLGLEWDGRTLTGYDGCFELPAQVLKAVAEMGFSVSPDLIDDEGAH